MVGGSAMARHLLLTSSEGGPAQELGGVSTLALFIAPSPQPSALTLLHTRCAASEKSQDQLSVASLANASIERRGVDRTCAAEEAADSVAI
jgi:hypothetical protein